MHSSLSLGKASSFRHGIHPDELKEMTNALQVERLPFVEEYVLHLSQHTGAPSRPLVAAGMRVMRGQMIAAPDGYISTNVQLNDKKEPFVRPNLHEMYNMGHLLTAACVHHRATGKTTFLDVARKLADCLYRNFRETEPARRAEDWMTRTRAGLAVMAGSPAD